MQSNLDVEGGPPPRSILCIYQLCLVLFSSQELGLLILSELTEFLSVNLKTAHYFGI